MSSVIATVEGAIWLLAVVAIGRGGAVVAERLWGVEATPEARWLVESLGALILLACVAELLLSVSLFNPWSITALAFVISVATWRGRLCRWWPSRRLERCAVILMGGLLVLMASGSSPSRDFDTLKYHVVAAAHFMVTGSLWTLPYGQPGEHTATAPALTEALSAMTMFAGHNVALGYWTNSFLFLVLALASAVLIRQCGGRRDVGVAVVVVLALSPLIIVNTWHSMLNDLLVAVSIEGPVALWLLGGRGSWSWKKVAFIGAVIGLGAGAKFSGLYALALLPCVFLLDSVFTERRLSYPMIRRLVGMWGVGLGIVLVWYVRNFVDTGNPLFPQVISIGSLIIFRGQHIALTIPETPIGVWLLAGEPRHLLALLRSFAIFGIFPLYGVVRAWWGPWDRSHRLIFSVGILSCLFFLATPFLTATAPSDGRFVIAGFLMCAIPGLASERSLSRVALAGVISIVLTLILIRFTPFVRADVIPSAPTFGVILAGGILAYMAPDIKQRMQHLRIDWLRLAPFVVGGAWVVSVLVTFQPFSNPLTNALAKWSGRGPVALVSVAPVGVFLGPHLTIPIVSLGIGTQGAQLPISGPALVRQAEKIRPSMIFVSIDNTDVPAQTFSAPHCWREVVTFQQITGYVIPASCTA